MFIQAYLFVLSHNILITSAVKNIIKKSSALANFRVPLRRVASIWTPGCRLGSNFTRLGAFGKISPPYVAETLRKQNKQLSSVIKTAHCIYTMGALKRNLRAHSGWCPRLLRWNVTVWTEVQRFNIITRLLAAALVKRIGLRSGRSAWFRFLVPRSARRSRSHDCQTTPSPRLKLLFFSAPPCGENSKTKSKPKLWFFLNTSEAATCP